MKLLAFSDLHCDADAAQRIIERSNEVDILVGAGDFAYVRRGIRTCIGVLRTSGRPTIVVPGNNESFEELRDACRDWPQARVLHGASAEVAGVTFFGLGGGVPVTPFGSWSYDFTEQQSDALLGSCPSGCVLVSHSPPKGTVDASSSGASIGSTAVLRAIERTKPRLVVCGHVHASGGQRGMIGTTPVINAGPEGMVVSF